MGWCVSYSPIENIRLCRIRALLYSWCSRLLCFMESSVAMGLDSTRFSDRPAGWFTWVLSRSSCLLSWAISSFFWIIISLRISAWLRVRAGSSSLISESSFCYTDGFGVGFSRYFDTRRLCDAFECIDILGLIKNYLLGRLLLSTKFSINQWCSFPFLQYIY
jgi:hypothetical protein